MTQAMIFADSNGLRSLAHRASRRKGDALGGNPMLRRRTERRECVESISVTAGHEPPRGLSGARSILIFHASVNGDKVSRWGPAESDGNGLAGGGSGGCGARTKGKDA